MGISWKGMNKLTAVLNSNLKQTAVKRIVKQNGSEMQQKAMRRAPVRTGFMKRSIVLNMEDEGLTARVTAGAHYSPYVEYGTRRHPTPQPFIRPSFNEQKEQFMHDLSRLTK